MAKMMHPAAMLRKDHRTVKGLFRRFERTRGAERQRVAQEIIENLSVHATIEEMLVYPLLRMRDKRMNDDVLEALEEHHVAKMTLLELDKMRVSDERYAAKMMVLREAVEMHIAEEESMLLPRLEALLDDEEAEAITAEAMQMKNKVPNHPHPMAPDTPPGNVVAGPLAKVLDGAKDILRRVTNPAKAQGHKRVVRAAKADVKAGKRMAGMRQQRATRAAAKRGTRTTSKKRSAA